MSRLPVQIIGIIGHRHIESSRTIPYSEAHIIARNGTPDSIDELGFQISLVIHVAEVLNLVLTDRTFDELLLLCTELHQLGDVCICERSRRFLRRHRMLNLMTKEFLTEVLNERFLFR